MVTQIKFTYQDYLLTPEDKRYELIEGELMMTPAPSWHHQTIAANLFRILDPIIKQNNLGKLAFAPVDVVLSHENVVQPDLLFVAKGRLEIITEKNVQGAPDLVIEILSPPTKERDLDMKRKIYAKYGVREYWLVDPQAKTVEVAVLKESGLETFQVFPCGTKVRSPLLTELLSEKGSEFSIECNAIFQT